MSLKKYNNNQEISVAVDCVIIGYDQQKLNVLLFKRKVNPLKGCWSLLGEVPDAKKSMDQCALDIIFKLTGADDIYLNQLKTYGNIDRDPLERVISIVYFCLIKVDYFNKIDLKKHNVKWFDLNKTPQIILDHNKMIEEALIKLRDIAKTQPLGFKLLPKLFTLPQLQNLYECIYNTEFDSRNFRKKIISSGFLEKSDKKDKSSSKKGAYLYRFKSNNDQISPTNETTNMKDVFQF
jgi:hypothetical protein